MKKIFQSIIIFLKITQTVSNENKRPRLGRGYDNAMRMNPYNPLSYISIIIVGIIISVLNGVIGGYNYFKINHFKWD